MNKATKICIALITAAVFASALIGCEEDDICADSEVVTPRLVIRFMDIDDRQEINDVVGLQVTHVTTENDTLTVFNTPTTTDSLGVALLTSTQLTTYAFTTNTDGDSSLELTDTIQFRYQTEFEYVSRACGFRSIYTSLNITNLNNQWIQDIDVENQVIENEETAHVRFFH